MKPKKTVKEGERRASSKILDEMDDLISEARRLARKNKIAVNKVTDN